MNTPLDELIECGRQLSNLAFNLSQSATLTAANRETMRTCQRNWDDALRKYRADPTPTPPPAFDAGRWLATLEYVIHYRKVSTPALSAQTGVRDYTIGDVRAGLMPDAATLVALSLWAGINPGKFVR